MARREHRVDEIGLAVLSTLEVAIATTTADTEAYYRGIDRSQQRRLDARIKEFRLVEQLETARRRPRGASIDEWIELIKAILKLAKHVLPIDRLWKSFINELLDLINLLLLLFGGDVAAA